MDSMNAPSKEEVMGWNPKALADYMRQLHLSSCDRVVLKGSITGAQFLYMMHSQLEVFPSQYIPILANIQWRITTGEQRKTISPRSKTQSCFTKVYVQDEEVQDSDESNSGSDNDYLWPEEKTREENFIFRPTSAEPQPACPLSPKPPKPPPPRAHDRHREGSTDSSLSTLTQPGASVPTDLNNRASKLLPVPPVPAQPAKFNKATPAPRKCLDPSWYGAQLTRRQAEAVLRAVSKDGTFLVRDSSMMSVEHPYTLMLLHQGKVYNIRIRHQGNSYLLGNGLNNTKSFPGVKEMIIHHTSNPLLLIDAKDRSSADQPQCCLLHPAGL